MNQFTEVKVIYSGAVQYRMPKVRDDQQGAAAVNTFQLQDRGTYIAYIKEKDREHFGTAEATKGPLENLFRRLDFKLLVFGTFGEMSSYVKEVVDMAVESVWGGTLRSDDGSHDGGWSQDGTPEAVHDAIVHGSLEGLCQSDP